MVLRVAWILGLLLFAFSLTACLSFDESRCADGRVCPPGHRCDADGTCIPLSCGNETIDEGELCDSGDLAGKSCIDFGAGTREGLVCTSRCALDVSACNACGDGIVFDTDEACDDGVPVKSSCLAHALDLGRVGCSQCELELGGCGALGWRTVPSPTGQPLFGIWGASADDIYIVGATGTVLRRKNGQFQAIPSATGTLRGVWGSSATDVFFVGGDDTTNVIFHYDGTTLVDMPRPSAPTKLQAIWGSGPNDVYAAGKPALGGGPAVLHYNGTAWSAVVGTTTMRELRAIWGSSPSDVFAVGAVGTIFHYNGTAWTLEPDPPDSQVDGPADLTALWGTAANNIYAVSRRREVFRFNGASWEQSPMQTPPVGGAVDSFAAIVGGAPDDIFVIGTEAVTPLTPALLHFDGARWAKLVPPSNYKPLNAIWRAPNGDVWAAGDAGYVVQWGGAGWTVTSSGVSSTLRGVASVGPSDAWAVGDNGVIRRYDGSTWAQHTSNTNSALFSIWAPNASFASTTGAAGTIRHFNGTWTTPMAPAAPDLFAVWGFTPNNIFAAGAGGVARRFGGTSWSAIASAPPEVDLSDLWGASDTDLHAVGFTNTGSLQGVVYRYQGTSWSESISRAALNTRFLRGAWGSAANDVFAVGDAVFHYSNSWTRMTENGLKLHAVAGNGPRDVFAAGDGGTLLHYDGIDWTPIRVLSSSGTPVTSNLRGIAVTPRSVIVAGDSGFVQRLSFSRRPSEVNCRDAWDDDGDGLPDCSDPDCKDDPYCVAGGSCKVARQALACGTKFQSTTVGRQTTRDFYRCNTRACGADTCTNEETGPDVTYRFESATPTTVTVTLTELAANLDLVVVGSMPASRACDPDFACLAAGAAESAAETVTFTADADRAYYVIVEGRDGASGEFALEVTCTP